MKQSSPFRSCNHLQPWCPVTRLFWSQKGFPRPIAVDQYGEINRDPPHIFAGEDPSRHGHDTRSPRPCQTPHADNSTYLSLFVPYYMLHILHIIQIHLITNAVYPSTVGTNHYFNCNKKQSSPKIDRFHIDFRLTQSLRSCRYLPICINGTNLQNVFNPHD